MSASSDTGIQDWEKYFSKSNQAWCWMSKSRKVTYLSASKSQPRVFEAGWVVLPAKSKIDPPGFYNVFSGKTVMDRNEISEYVDPTAARPATGGPQTTDSRKRKERPDEEVDDGGITAKKKSLDVVGDDGDDQKKAADHYGKLQRNQVDRMKGSLAKMRALNNWVKVVLLEDNMSRSVATAHANSSTSSTSASVLELACGKGGDYFKIERVCPRHVQSLHYIGIDIAKGSLDDFVERLRQRTSGESKLTTSSSVRLVCANLGTDRLCGDPSIELPCWTTESGKWTSPPDGGEMAFETSKRFDFVTMQFALHYMMESNDRLAKFFQSWSHQLSPGGYFVATTMDSKVVRELLRTSSSGPTVRIQDENGRTCCEMVFDAATMKRVNDESWNWNLGQKYDMTLTEYTDPDDKEGTKFVDAPEWVVPMTALIHNAWKYASLFLVDEESCNFENFYQTKSKIGKYNEKLYHMKVLDRTASDGDDLSKTEWKLAKLYRTLVFKKNGNGRQRRIAIVVPFRDQHAAQQRSKHLAQFVPYMLMYMGKTNLPFHIFIIEQSNDGRKFNRGKLLNVGYKIARERRCDAFIFHDVDLLPDDDLLKHYRCDGEDFETVPDHIARVWSRYSGNKDYIGGVTAFSSRCFERINGFPNNFWGWGGEDDEVRNRLAAVKQHFSAPEKGSLTDLENMTIKEKMEFLRKQNTDNEGSDNTWKCMVKKEVLNEHAKTWRNNGLFYTGGDGKRKETKLYSRSKEDPHPSGFASKITVELTSNNDRWDTVTSWKDLH